MHSSGEINLRRTTDAPALRGPHTCSLQPLAAHVKPSCVGVGCNLVDAGLEGAFRGGVDL